MEVLVVASAGFCFGVKRAVDTAFDIAGKRKQGVFTLGPIIHNPQVVARLSERNVFIVENVEEPAIRALIIRTHGVPLQTMEAAERKGYDIIDATCPFVKKAQRYARLLNEEGYQVVILGDREHPEVRGLMSYAGDDVVDPGYAAESGTIGVQAG